MQAAKEGKPLDEISVSDLNFTISYLAPVETPWWISFLPFIVTTLLFLGPVVPADAVPIRRKQQGDELWQEPGAYV